VTDLRPRSLGEILDRAVTLTVRNFVPFAIIWFIFEVPDTLVTFFVQGSVESIQTQILVQVVLSSVSIFPQAALAWAVCERYSGRPVSTGSAYRIALRRLPANFTYNLMWTGVALVASIPAVIAGLFVAFAAGSAPAADRTAVAIVLSIPLALGFIVAVCLAVVPYLTGWFAVVADGEAPRTAFRTALRRSLAPRVRLRTLLGGFAFWAIVVGTYVVVGAGAAGIVLLGLPSATMLWLYVASPVMLALVLVYLMAFMAVYYYDQRVRDEGYDLHLRAQAESGTA
jgi:hypothetical protein